MEYTVYRLHFTTGVHFGTGSLGDSGIGIHADTLFSALCIEAASLHGGDGPQMLADAVQNGELRLSDLQPFIGDELYLPKPLLQIRKEKDGDSTVKKSFKKLHWIPVSQFSTYLDGNLDPLAEVEKLGSLGKFEVRTMAASRSPEKIEAGDTLPYSVGVYKFADGNGLYLLVGFGSVDIKLLFERLLDSLSYTGIGGKRSAGLGRFTVEHCQVDESFSKRLEGDGVPAMTLSVAMATDEQLEQVLDGAQYLLQKRSGFVASENYATEPHRKRDFYAFCAGSCFRTRFSGGVFDVSSGGSHPVYRYAAPLWLEV